MPDLRERQYAFLVIIGLASDFTSAKYISSGDGVRAPRPTAQQVRGGLAIMCEAMNIQRAPIPIDAHFSHGKAKRRILTLKGMSVRMLHEMGAIWPRHAIASACLFQPRSMRAR